jgi:hypothetical protein
MATPFKPGTADNVIPFSGRKAKPKDAPDGKTDAPDAQLSDVAMDLVQLALDVAGMVDPTPTCDGASALLSLARGAWLDAALSGVSMVPYIGDLAKAGKLPKYLKTVEKAILLADKSADAAKKLLPGMEKLQQALELLPAGANGYIDSIRTQVTAFVRKHGGRTKGLTQLPDISRHFAFKTIDYGDRVMKEASGRLGVPSKVKRHRKSDPSAAKAAQSGVSRGSGDHAGHLVADRFGASHGAKNSSGLGTENLSLQNWRMNSYGSWYELEAEWARKLELGHGFDVNIQDWYRKGENRPYKRTISGTETLPDGTKKHFNVEGEEGQVIYGNFETAKSRDAKGTNTVNPGGKKGELIQGPWQPH